MPSDWRAHRTLRSAERRALSWIRGAIGEAISHPNTDTTAAQVAELFEACRSGRPSFLALGSPYASPDERAFVALVAQMQRETPNVPHLPEEPMARLAAYIASQLWAAGIRLPISAGSEVMDFKRHTARRGATIDSAPRLQNGTTKHRVFELLTNKRAASRHELLALGMSRQYLSILIRAGFLIQSGRSLYRLAEAAPE